VEAMPKRSEVTITDHFVRTAKPTEKQWQVRDAGKLGLILRVYPTGKKAYLMEVERNVIRTVGDGNQLTPKQAWTRAKKIQADYLDGKKGKTSKLTLKGFIQGEYKDFAVANGEHGEQEVTRMLAVCEPLLRKRLGGLATTDIERWKRERLEKVKPVTVKRELAKLKAALTLAVRWGKLTKNPATHVTVKVPKENRVRYLDADERKRLFNEMATRDKKLKQERLSANQWRLQRGYEPLTLLPHYGDHLTPLVILVLNTGLRKTEALTLRWSDINLGNTPMLTVQAPSAKAKTQRHIPLNEDAVDTLQKWQKQAPGDTFVFTNPETGQPIKDVKTAWLHLLDDAKIEDFRFHDLRHDFASRLVMAEVDLYRVKELLGHSTIVMTERYAHLAPQALSDAVAKLTDVNSQ
jgi:integrase